MEQLKRMDVGEFVRRFKHDIEDIDDSKFVFLIGAGCSVSSGIPCAKDLANVWLRRLKKLRKGNDDNLEEWARQEFPDYAPESAALYYGKIIEKLFLRPEARQREIEQLTEGKDPGFGYAVLAKLMSHEKYGGHCNAVLTVNFDDLIADALYLYTHKKPLVIVHDSLVGFVRSARKRPLVLKLHGDARLEPKNTESETTELADSVKKVLKNFLSETGLVFIGYGGHDESIANILKELPRDALPWGIFWVNTEVPDSSIGEWLRERNAIWVDHTDFDELMLLIWNEFKLSHPDEARFTKLMDTYKDTFADLSKKLDSAPESEIKKELSNSLDKAIGKADWWGSLVEAERNWGKNPAKAEKIYIELIDKYPNNTAILNNYGYFLHFFRKDYVRAEESYKKVLELDPNTASTLENYAVLLFQICKDYDKAEDYYKKSLEIDPNKANRLGNYAGFLLAKGDEQGFVLLKKAKYLAEQEQKRDIILELSFYEYAHSNEIETRRESLVSIKSLLNQGIKSPGWDLSENIKRAVENGHPHPNLLSEISKVISGESDVKNLDQFEAWSRIEPIE